MTKPCRGLVDAEGRPGRHFRANGPQDHVLFLWSDPMMSIHAVESGFTKVT
jgi:hypothetical protein